MKRRSKRRLIIGVSIVLALAVIGTISSLLPRQKESPHELGERLLLAAEEHNWKTAQTLLEEGADPNVTAFTPPKDPGPFWDWLYMHGLPKRDWRSRIKIEWSISFGPIWERPCPLVQAIDQNNMEAVNLLLRYKADIHPALHKVAWTNGPDQVELFHLLLDNGGGWKKAYEDVLGPGTQSGNRELIYLLEDLAQVPVNKRNISRVPFAPGAETAHYEVVPGTVGAVPMQNLLWVSPHELLVLRDAPRRFALIDLKTGSETDLPQLSKRWAAQELFDPNVLAVSPDGKWLVGFGGTKDHATWLATEVRGDGVQEWDRVMPDHSFVTENSAQCAWQDDRRWIEMNIERNGKDINGKNSYHEVARMRMVGSKQVRQVTLIQHADSAAIPCYFLESTSPFSFLKPNEGLVCGESRSYNDETLVPLARVVPGTTELRLEDFGVDLKLNDYSGRFWQYALSPDGKRLAWLNFFEWSAAKDVVLTGLDGKNARIVYEFLKPNYDDSATKSPDAPWPEMLEWNPQGDGLLFWRGFDGKNGLCLLRLTPEELR